MLQRAIFLDRDGTLNKDLGYTHEIARLRLLEGVVPGLKQLTALGFRLVIVTNQSGVARGRFSEDDMRRFNAALCERLANEGIAIAGVYHCPYHPTDGVGRYRRDSECRKPRPGMLLAAARELALDLTASFAIGDKISDMAAGQAAGCHTILVETGRAGRGEPELTARPDAVARDLAHAARLIAEWPESFQTPSYQDATR
ncbi:MAG TPA: D-glycero-beta-D-manno-heptose 1,7-bisphosphate 7-phosphatase [Pirellulales bacterium]|jgi:D-glycero-D-manno-heptose 1,7-bisphosphate phosphatase|nr:D-glycero-beta-D-manno-heptose 1,7-bisphosphate 7-phosphatase [Pirellulales bacterium]